MRHCFEVDLLPVA